MRILLTGGGSGGHFYPLIAIAEQINKIVDEENLLDIKIYYMSDKPYDKKALFETNIKFIQVPAGKMRIYSSFKNFLDIFKIAVGAVVGILRVFAIYPDVIISKGGYAAFPAVFAGRILHIPIIIHESDSAPGRSNLWASKFAKRIAVSYAEAGEKFPKEKTAWVGQPIRNAVLRKSSSGGYDFFKLDPNLKTIFILGGSQGAEVINNVILEMMPEILEKYQIIHQAGAKNIEEVKMRANLVLEKSSFKHRYVSIGFMSDIQTSMASGISDLIISRAGSTIFEIACWGTPSIIIPITKSNGDHQRKNAFTYARSGACVVIEEANLEPHLLRAEIDKLLNSEDRLAQMSEKAKEFSTPKAAEQIAKEAINIGLTHQ